MLLTAREQQLMLFAVRAGYFAGMSREKTSDEVLIKKATDYFVKVNTPVEGNNISKAPTNNDHEQDGN